jgi:hypothetical protein
MDSPDIRTALRATHEPHDRRINLAAELGERALDITDMPRLAGNDERTMAFRDFRDHLINIAADPSGSDLTPYLSTETLAALVEFEQQPAEKRWRGATPITHDDITFRWLHKRKLNTPVLDSEDKPIYGRRVGYLSVGQFESPVLYCSDRKLRMLIKTTGDRYESGFGTRSRHRKHTYVGYCRLPDPELAMPLRDRGAEHLVLYKHQQSKTLREELGLPKPTT